MRTVEVAKSALATARIVESEDRALVPGQARLKVESFAVTANNVTYAVIGDAFGYWNFFPSSESDYGVVPMWGHALVEESTHPELAVGERLYGYLPMASHLIVDPGKITATGFTDISAHRQPMSPIYNHYSRLAADPEHVPAREDARMIFGPLFKTGFLIESFFRAENWFGAKYLVMSSASSKTALALAHCVKQTSPEVQIIGLTSERNVAFVAATGLFETVADYANLFPLLEESAVFVDFAGNAGVLRSVHERLEGKLKYSCLVGATHVGKRGGTGDPVPGPAPILFFAPDHARTAIEAMGAKAFAEAVAKSWSGFVDAADDWIRIERRDGLDAAVSVFQETMAGAADPAIGVVIRP